MTPYPDSLPLDAINVIVTDIRNNAVLTDRENFAKAVWELEGYGLKVSLGDPSPVGPTPVVPKQSLPEADLTDADVLAHLDPIVNPNFDFGDAPEGAKQGIDLAVAIAALPWRAILKWALSAVAAAL